MSERVLSPQEVIIRELIDRSWPEPVYGLSTYQFMKRDAIYDLSTLQFLRVHINNDGHQLHYISCNTLNGGQDWFYMVVELEQGYWDIGAAWPTTPPDQVKQSEFQDLPWASLASAQAWGLARSFCVFGEVIEKDFPIKTVRLVCANGFTVEDQVEQGLVLFISKEVIEHPVWVELYDEGGICANRHLFWDFSWKDR